MCTMAAYHHFYSAKDYLKHLDTYRNKFLKNQYRHKKLQLWKYLL